MAKRKTKAELEQEIVDLKAQIEEADKSAPLPVEIKPEYQEPGAVESNELVPTDDAKFVQLVNPDKVMQFALTLRGYIAKNNLSTAIQGKQYVNVDGWKFAGLNYGMVPRVTEPKRIDDYKTVYIIKRKVVRTKNGRSFETWVNALVTTVKDKFDAYTRRENESYEEFQRDYFAFSCSCELVSIATGKIVGTGHAICTNEETAKSEFDLYAVSSMAQTRAISKAFRNTIGFVMKSAGYEPTPSEEMPADPEPAEGPKRTRKPSNGIELMTEDQQTELNKLLDDPRVSKSDRETIRQHMPKFTSERAEQCINNIRHAFADMELDAKQ